MNSNFSINRKFSYKRELRQGEQYMGMYSRTSSQDTVLTLLVGIQEGHGKPHGGDNV